MPTLLYGLTTPDEAAAAGDRVARLAGVSGGAVRVLAAGALAAIVSDVAAKPAPSLEVIRAHDHVLGQFVDAGATVAAVRFGQLFADDAACLRELRDRGARLHALLRDHHGCVEMRVLVPVEDEAPPGVPQVTPASRAGPGRAYLESLRARGQVAPNLALRPMLGPLVRAERVEGFASPKGRRGVAFAHLVHRAELPAYRDALAALPALGQARVVGPLPLYSFAEPQP